MPEFNIKNVAYKSCSQNNFNLHLKLKLRLYHHDFRSKFQFGRVEISSSFIAL